MLLVHELGEEEASERGVAAIGLALFEVLYGSAMSRAFFCSRQNERWNLYRDEIAKVQYTHGQRRAAQKKKKKVVGVEETFRCHKCHTDWENVGVAKKQVATYPRCAATATLKLGRHVLPPFSTMGIL